jgi:hypothetical protein
MGVYDKLPLIKTKARKNERHNTTTKEVLHNLLCKKA